MNFTRLTKIRSPFKSNFSIFPNPIRRFGIIDSLIKSQPNVNENSGKDDDFKRNSFKNDFVGSLLTTISGTQLCNVHNYYHNIDQHVYALTLNDLINFWGSYGYMISGIGLFPVGLLIIRQRHATRANRIMMLAIIGLICWLGCWIYSLNNTSQQDKDSLTIMVLLPNQNKKF